MQKITVSQNSWLEMSTKLHKALGWAEVGKPWHTEVNKCILAQLLAKGDCLMNSGV